MAIAVARGVPAERTSRKIPPATENHTMMSMRCPPPFFFNEKKTSRQRWRNKMYHTYVGRYPHPWNILRNVVDEAPVQWDGDSCRCGLGGETWKRESGRLSPPGDRRARSVEARSSRFRLRGPPANVSQRARRATEAADMCLTNGPHHGFANWSPPRSAPKP